VTARTDDQDRKRLRLLYGMDQIEQDENGTWWIGSDSRPRLLNMDSVAAAVAYLDGLPAEMLDRLAQPRGADSELGGLR